MIENKVIQMDLNMLSQYGAYGILLLMGLWKGIKYLIPFIVKNFLNKKTSKTDVTVNLNNCATPITEFTGSKQDFKSMLILFLNQGKILTAMHNLKPDILEEQKNYFNRHRQNIKMMATNIIVELLKEANIDESLITTYFSNFENFSEVCEIRVLNKYEEMCKDNHFAEYNEKDYRELVDRNIFIIENILGDLLRKRYIQREYIKNFKRVYELHPSIQAGLRDCFDQAREVAIEKAKKVNEAKTCYEAEVSDILGMKFSLEI
jgi:hypothetical protein